MKKAGAALRRQPSAVRQENRQLGLFSEPGTGDRGPETARLARVSDRLAERGFYPVLRKLAARGHVAVDDVLGTARDRSVVRVRHALWAFLRHEAGLSTAEIGRMLEVDHTTILYGTGPESVAARDRVPTTAERIAAYVRGLGYEVLARDIEAGAWRRAPGAAVSARSAAASDPPSASRRRAESGERKAAAERR